MNFSYRGFNIPVELLNMTGGGVDTFESISQSHIEYLRQRVGIEPSHRFLEIGCGIGRDAIPLTAILSPPGSYLGVDIIGRSVAWCRENISAAHPHFRFAHFDIEDALHNPAGQFRTTDMRIPLPDASVDRVILWSVLTHMFEADITHYFKEFLRVLAPGGKVLATCFAVNEQVLSAARKVNLTPWNLRFEHPIGNGCYINDPNSPAGAVAFDDDAITRMVRSSGLDFQCHILRGSWFGAPEQEGAGQDVLILRKP